MKLVVEGVSKKYAGGVWGLRDFTLDLGVGVLGLLGPNGAGKSTLLRILATVSKPTTGKVTWDGVDVTRSPDTVREVLGYLPQDFGVYPNLTAVEFLEYLAAARGIHGRAARARIDVLLELVALSHVRNRPLGGFSGGMRQRVGIAQALLNDPRLVIVDEPTAGLDPEERVRFRGLLADLSGERIVILSTHIVSDVESTATSIALIHGGRLVTCAAPDALLRSAEGRVWGMVVPGEVLEATQRAHVISATARRADGVHLRVLAAGAPASDARPLAPTLEDAYLDHLNRHRAAAVA